MSTLSWFILCLMVFSGHGLSAEMEQCAGGGLQVSSRSLGKKVAPSWKPTPVSGSGNKGIGLTRLR